MTLPLQQIFCNHLGFRPDDPLKRAIMPIGQQTTGLLGTQLFRLVHVTEFIQHALNSPGGQQAMRWYEATVEETPLGRFAVCDFSAETARGGYQLFADAGASYPFLIYQDAWKRVFPLLLDWYRIASCGEAVLGYHEACHLDDCQRDPTGEHVDLVGGWHDAGDLRKWTSTMALVSQRLADFVNECGDHLDALGVDEALVWRQLERGATYLLKTVDPISGLAWHNVASEGDNSCNVWTDNIPGTPDDRHLDPTIFPSTQYSYIQAQCALARALHTRQPELAARIVISAEDVWARLAAEPGTLQVSTSALELWLATGNETYRAIVWDNLRLLLARQCTGQCFGQSVISGFLLEGDAIAFNADFRKRGGRNLLAHSTLIELLARALILWPQAMDAPRWRDGLTLLLEGLIEPMLHVSPYRVLPVCLYAHGDGPANGRPLAGDLRFRYFGAEAEGNNAGLLDTAAALTLAARALGQPKWAAYGQKHLEWVVGFNPFDTSMLTGIGYSQAAVFSYYVGQIPGGIINGIKGDPVDKPHLCMHRQTEPMMMEYWSVHTAAMLRALALLDQTPLR